MEIAQPSDLARDLIFLETGDQEKKQCHLIGDDIDDDDCCEWDPSVFFHEWIIDNNALDEWNARCQEELNSEFWDGSADEQQRIPKHVIHSKNRTDSWVASSIAPKNISVSVRACKQTEKTEYYDLCAGEIGNDKEEFQENNEEWYVSDSYCCLDESFLSIRKGNVRANISFFEASFSRRTILQTLPACDELREGMELAINPFGRAKDVQVSLSNINSSTDYIEQQNKCADLGCVEIDRRIEVISVGSSASEQIDEVSITRSPSFHEDWLNDDMLSDIEYYACCRMVSAPPKPQHGSAAEVQQVEKALCQLKFEMGLLVQEQDESMSAYYELCNALVDLSAEAFRYVVLRMVGAMETYEEINETLEALAVLMTKQMRSNDATPACRGPAQRPDSKQSSCLDGVIVLVSLARKLIR